jgi:hypothetical protein
LRDYGRKIMQIRPLTETERKYAYTQGRQIIGQTGYIGNLRGDLGRDGDLLFTSWEDRREELKTDELLEDLEDAFDVLQSKEYGLLANQSAMRRFMEQHPGSGMDGNDCTEYGFRVETDKYAFLLRCNPIQGYYNLYCYCYVKDWLDSHIKSAEKGIRFIDSHYNELFRIADGEQIVITEMTGEKKECTCRYIDEYHTAVGNSLYHICEFAELMERRGASYAPMEPERKEMQESLKSLIYHSEYGGDEEIQLEIRQYANNDGLAIVMNVIEDGYPEQYANLTVNLNEAAPDYCGYLDINNLSNAEKFVTENGLGEFTGFTKTSGYGVYPLYMFNAVKLRELCPEQMEAYEKSIGTVSKTPEKAKSR